jgi:hypothetical protein
MIENLRKLLMYEIVAMHRNLGQRPGFLILEEQD